MPNPTFTVIISTYNRAGILPNAIRSVLGQTYGDFECLVIDNGSTDATAEAVKGFKDGRIRYIRNPKPTRSCDGPRNMGIEMARAPLVAFLDDDDIWYPERLAKVKHAFDEHPDIAAVCHHEARRVNGRIDQVLVCGPWSSDMHERLLYERNCLSSCATTVRTEILRTLGGFDLRDEVIATSDYDLWIRMASRGYKVHFIDEPLGEFTVTGKNWSVVNPAFESKVALLVKNHLSAYEKKPLLLLSTKGLQRLLKLYLIAARAFARGRKPLEASAWFFRACLIIAARPSLVGRLTKI